MATTKCKHLSLVSVEDRKRRKMCEIRMVSNLTCGLCVTQMGKFHLSKCLRVITNQLNE